MKKKTTQKTGRPIGKTEAALVLLDAAAAAGQVAPRRAKRGRKKEKTQISVRLDKTLMDIVYHHIGNSKEKITDALERGMLYVMQRDFQAPPIASQARFIAANADRPTREYMVAAAVVYRFDQLFELDTWEVSMRRHFLDYLDWIKRDERYARVLESLGKPTEEDPEPVTEGNRRTQLTS